MYLYYCTFKVPPENRAEFDAWMIEVTRQCQAQDGCVVYEYLTNPARPDEGVLFAAWATREHQLAHRIFPAHVEMAALGSSEWGQYDLTNHVWPDAEGHMEVTYATTDDSATGELGVLVREFMRTRGAAAGG